MNWQAFGFTDRGLKRDDNEDAYLVRSDLGLFAVADGMGGHAAGDVASRIAVETLERELEGMAPDLRVMHRGVMLRDAVRAANRAIFGHAAADPEKAGMGTTVTALALTSSEPACVLAHVGDSRAYRLRGGRLRQVTTDHTWVQQQVSAGYLTPQQAREHPFANVLNRALGVHAEVDVDLVHAELEPGDLLLLCSDGLTGMLGDEDLHEILDRDASLEALAHGLIEAANQRGGLDNITAVLIRVAD